jgi:cell division protein FtsN
VSENELTDFYTVVLASFSSAESANKHVANIKRQGFRPFYFTKEISGKTWHRVGMGSFKLKRDALKLQNDLSENKFAKGSLISKITVNNQ